MMSRSTFTMLALLGSLLFLANCGGDDGGSVLGDCPPDSAARQAQGKAVLDQDCASCHGSTVTGVNRGGAPLGTDFDVESVVRQRAEDMYEKALGTFPTGTIMPPPPAAPLSNADTESLRVYLACLVQ